MGTRPTIILLAAILTAAGCTAESETSTTTVASTPTTVTATTSSTGPSSTIGSTQPPAPPPAPLAVVGDWGSGTVPQGAVSGAIDAYAEANGLHALLTTGDNFYADNADFLMAPYGWVGTRDIPWWITWGNHDVETDSRIDVVNATFDNPPRWTVHQWGQVDVVILDSNQVTDITQAAFFLAAMADSDRPMIVALHHPPYSCSHHGSTIEVVNAFVSVLDDDVVLVLSGHDHSYQRFENDDVQYVVTGGGGRLLRPLTDCPDNHPPRLAGADLHHFVALEQTANSIEVTAIDVNGEEIDSTSIPLP